MNSDKTSYQNDKVYTGQPRAMNKVKRDSDEDTNSGYVFLQFIIVYLIVLVIVTLVLQASWNVSMPGIFGLPQVDFIQTLGLLIVSCLLLKR